MDSKGESEEITYPKLYFAIDAFEEVCFPLVFFCINRNLRATLSLVWPAPQKIQFSSSPFSFLLENQLPITFVFSLFF